MGPRGLVSLLATAVAVGAAVAGPAQAGDSVARQAGQAGQANQDAGNIVFVLTDDMRFDDLEHMPNVQRLLADRGVTYTNAVSPYPLCCPARAMLATGQYNHNNGVMGNRWPQGSLYRLERPTETIGTWLQRAGYRTGFVGKWLNGYGDPLPEGYTGPVTDPDAPAPGWDYWAGGVSEGLYDFDSVSLVEQQADGSYARVHHRRYVTDVLNDKADEFVGDATAGAAANRPFFLWLNHVAPHGRVVGRDANGQLQWTPPLPAEQDADVAFPHVDDAGPRRLERLYPGWGERDVSDKWSPVRGLGPSDVARTRSSVRQRLQSLLSVDRGVADLVRRLRATGELASTTFVFASDNGFAVGEHRHYGKDLPYEPELRVPVVLAGHGIAPRRLGASRGGEVDDLVTLADVTATLVDLAGAGQERRRRPDGISLLRPERNPDNRAGPGRAVVIEAGNRAVSGPRRWTWLGVRSPRYTSFAWTPDFARPVPTGKHELYRYRDGDPQLQNLADSPRHRKQARALRRLAYDQRDCAGARPDAPGSCVFSAPPGT